jgi:hypothetical protein
VADAPTNLHKRLTKRAAAGKAGPSAAGRRYANMAEQRAKRKLGPAWQLLSRQMRGAFIALEALEIIAAQQDGSLGSDLAMVVLEKGLKQ